jgi:hypothetical protein
MTVISEWEEWLQPSIVAAIHFATACSSALLAKRRLHHISGDGEGGTTGGIRGCRVGRWGDKGYLMGNLIGPDDFTLAADGVDGVEMERSPRRIPA